MNIFKFKSKPKDNVFAPEWDYTIGESFLHNINFNKLSKFLLSKEKEILTYKTSKDFNGNISDGFTGLGETSTTSKYQNYNVLNFKYKEIKEIKKQIFNFYNLFLKKINIKPFKNIYIQCWVNIMRQGQKINPHIHDVTPYSYLGGHICVQVKNTNTYYINPVNQINDPEIYSSKNEVGKITLFQNCVPHYTDIHKDVKERITIAFDLNYSKKNLNEILL
jgi:hypothetical protein